jgi:AcrR family transcriptional regulator
MATRKPPVRKRRSSDEARAAILDAAERLLREVGPGGIRLQEVARQVGVSHPTVLHHFGSREGLIEAVVERALASIHEGLVEAITSTDSTDDVAALLTAVSQRLREGGRARTFLWLALAGFGPGVKALQVKTVSEVVHEVRKHKWAERKEKVPPFEDTWFTVLLPALALLSLSVLEDCADPDFDPARFRAWLARKTHEHLERG